MSRRLSAGCDWGSACFRSRICSGSCLSKTGPVCSTLDGRAEGDAHGERGCEIARLVSIHALCVEGDGRQSPPRGRGHISIRAFRGGGRRSGSTRWRRLPSSFNPHPPGGGRPCGRVLRCRHLPHYNLRHPFGGSSRILPFNEAAHLSFRRFANSRKNGRKARGLSRSSCAMCRLPWYDNAPLRRVPPPPFIPGVRRARENPLRGSFRR